MGEQEEDEGFVTRIGSLAVDWPRTIGFYGGIALAVGFELIAPEIALFAAAVPLLKLLKRRGAPTPVRFVAAVLEGASKPVGGDAEATVRLADRDEDDAAESEAKDPVRPSRHARTNGAAQA